MAARLGEPPVRVALELEEIARARLLQHVGARALGWVSYLSASAFSASADRTKPGAVEMTPANDAHGALDFQRRVRSSTISREASGASKSAVQALLVGSRIQSIWYLSDCGIEFRAVVEGDAFTQAHQDGLRIFQPDLLCQPRHDRNVAGRRSSSAVRGNSSSPPSRARPVIGVHLADVLLAAIRK